MAGFSQSTSAHWPRLAEAVEVLLEDALSLLLVLAGRGRCDRSLYALLARWAGQEMWLLKAAAFTHIYRRVVWPKRGLPFTYIGLEHKQQAVRRACELHSGAIAAAADQALVLAELAGSLARLESQVDGEELEEKPLASVPEESDTEECDIHTTEEKPLGRASLEKEPLSSGRLKVVRACSPETDGVHPKTTARTPEARLSLPLNPNPNPTLTLTRP